VARISSLLLAFVAILLWGCSPEVEIRESSTEEGGSQEFANPVSYWDLLGDLNKIEDLHLEVVPPPAADGSLPRTTGDFSLGMQLPRSGEVVRDMEILLLQEKGGNRRVRLFSRDESVYRISCFTKKSYAEENRDVTVLFDQVRNLYGEPDKEIENELVYIDDYTVATFKSGGIYWIVEIEDIVRGSFSEDILLLIDAQYQEMVERERQR